MGGKVNDVNTKDSHVTDSHDAASEGLQVNKMRFADFRN